MNADEKKISKRIDTLGSSIQSVDARISYLYSYLEYLLCLLEWEQEQIYTARPSEFTIEELTATNHCDEP